MASNGRGAQSLKRTLTLDLNSAAPSKRARAAQHILTSPDVEMLKLTSPELAEFLTRNPTLATPTPSGGYVFPKTVTEEQEIFVKGFHQALQNLQDGPHEQAGQSTTAIEAIEKATAAHKAKMSNDLTTATNNSVSPRPSSSASGSMDSSDASGFQIKEEVEDDDEELTSDEDYEEEPVKGSKSGRGRGGRRGRGINMSPIDMASQERIKLERKRQRNRLAASKCRKRKLERIAQLEGKVNDLKGENGELANVVKRLKESVYNLKQEVLSHVNSGCHIQMMADDGSTYVTTTS